MSISTVMSAQDSAAAKRRAKEAFVNGLSLQMRPDMQAEAILEFQQALRYDSSAVILNAIARSYASMNKNTLALEYVQQALKLDPLFGDAWELQSEILVDLGKYDEAVESYEHIRSLNPSKRQLYTLGRLYEPRNAVKAIEVFEQLVREEPDEAIYVRIADLYKRIRNSEGRLGALSHAVDLNNRDADLASELIDAFIESGRFTEAHNLVRTWQGSERNTQIWASALNRLISDTLVLTLYRDSVAALLTELDKVPSKPWQLAVLAGIVAQGIEDTLLADRFLESALLPPRLYEGSISITTPTPVTSPEQYLQVAAAYMTFRRGQPGYDILTRGLARYPEDVRIILMLGMCAQQLDHIDEALKWFKKTIQMDSSIDEAWMNLGMLYDGIGEADSSESAYEHALALDPDNHLVNNNYAYSLAVRGKNLQAARAMSWRAVEQMPSNPSYLDTFAWVLYQLAEFEKAKVYIERAIAAGGNATHYEHLGDILEQLGDLDGAVIAWRKALQLDPSRDAVQNKLVKYR